MGNYLVKAQRSEQLNENQVVLVKKLFEENLPAISEDVIPEDKAIIDAFVDALYNHWHNHTYGKANKFIKKLKYNLKPFISPAPKNSDRDLGLVYPVSKLIYKENNRKYFEEKLISKNLYLKVRLAHVSNFLEVHAYNMHYNVLDFDWHWYSEGNLGPAKNHIVSLVDRDLQEIDKCCRSGELELVFNDKANVFTAKDKKFNLYSLKSLLSKQNSFYRSDSWPEINKKINELLFNFSFEYGLSINVVLIGEKISSVSIKRLYDEDRFMSGILVSNTSATNIMYKKMYALINSLRMMSPALVDEYNGLIRIAPGKSAEYVTYSELGTPYASHLDTEFIHIAKCINFKDLDFITEEIMAPYIFKRHAVTNFLSRFTKTEGFKYTDSIERTPYADSYRKELEHLLTELGLSVWIEYSNDKSITVKRLTIKKGLFPELTFPLIIEQSSDELYLNNCWN